MGAHRAARRRASAIVVDQPAADTGRPAGQPGWLSRARLAWIGAYLAAGVVLFLCYLRVSGTQSISSDGGSNALEAWDMLHGNLLLHGWTLTDVSFYTTELPEYMLVELIRGLRPAVVHTAAAFTYTLLVLLAGLLAKGRATGREGVVRVADRLRHHAGAPARQPRLRPARGARPRGHRYSHPADLPGPGPRAAALVCAARDRADAGLGARSATGW